MYFTRSPKKYNKSIIGNYVNVHTNGKTNVNRLQVERVENHIQAHVYDQSST